MPLLLPPIRTLTSALLFCAGLAAQCPEAVGLWAWHDLPRAQLDQKFDFQPDDAWFRRLRESTARIPGGHTAVFVSQTGLLMTAHHSAVPQVLRLAGGERLASEGYVARSSDRELRCPRAWAEVLVEIRDITTAVKESDAPSAKAEELARKAENEHGDRWEVVRRWGGAVYLLHRYERIDDLRLVWIPPTGIGQFGGEKDNFSFPRFALDAAVFRAYRNDKPIEPRAFLSLRRKAPAAGELVLAAGHPRRTHLYDTVAQLENARDVLMPRVLDSLIQRQKRAEQEHSPASGRSRSAFELANGIRALKGELQFLHDRQQMAARFEAEQKLAAAGGAPIEEALAQIAEIRTSLAPLHQVLWHAILPGDIAIRSRVLRRAKDEPSRITRTIEWLRTQRAVDLEREEQMLRFGLEEAREALGHDHPVVAVMLGGEPPEQRARSLLRSTLLDDPVRTARLLEDNPDAVFDDAMVALAAAIQAAREPFATPYKDLRRRERSLEDRLLRAVHSSGIGALSTEGDGSIRLSFGVVAGATVGTFEVPPKTTLGGMFDRSDSYEGRPPFDLPREILRQRKALNPATPLNFAATADVAGGFSGSPVVDRNGDLVGIVFDGNTASLGTRFGFRDPNGRMVAVTSAAVLEVLGTVYRARSLVDELTDR